MTSRLPTHAIPQPEPRVGTSADTVASGIPVPPIDRIKLFGSTQWEEFILEWADSLRDQYRLVERCGGAGDMGRDIIAHVKDQQSIWDNYQCKHYDHPLRPTDVWVELAKLAYYTNRGDYSYPRRYFFVAPQGAGTKLSNLLKRPGALLSGLLENWDRYCRAEITSVGPVDLDSALRGYVERLDFSIFEAVPPLRIIDQHAKTPWYAARFGGGLPARPPVIVPPAEPAALEAIYVRQLLDAYGDFLKRPVVVTSDIHGEGELREHFQDSRLEFYSAESLRVFSRDTLPPGEFEKLQDEVNAGIRDEIRSDHPDGYRRVIAVVKTARSLPLAAHPLSSRLSVRDHGGICHQLANDGKVRWTK